MKCTVYRRGIAAGMLTIEDDGLYRRICARIPTESEPVRLYAPQKLGVFVPEGEWMVLRRRISRRELPEIPAFAAALTEAEMRWSPAENGQLVRCTPLGQERAVRVQTDAPMVFPAAPERLRLILIEGAPHLCCAKSYVN